MSIDIMNLKLSAQRGLLGNVFPRLRAVCLDTKKNSLFICFYVDGKITKSNRDCCESVIDNIAEDFCNVSRNETGIEFATSIVRLDYPQKPPLIGHWIYYRSE